MDTHVKTSHNPFRLRELCAKMQELVDETANENAELTAHVKNMQAELDIWKEAARANRESSSQEVRTENGSQAIVEGRLALCVIDGTRTMFSPQYLASAEDGGRRAGHSLIRAVREKILGDNYDVGGFSIWVYIYLNKTKLFEELKTKGYFAAKQDFETFITGLNQCSPYVALVDVVDKDDADFKIRTQLSCFSRLPQTSHVFFAGGYASEFMSIYQSLRGVNAGHKLIFLHNKDRTKPGSMPPEVPVLPVDDLFLKAISLSSFIQRSGNGFASPPSPLSSAPPPSALPASGLFSPRSGTEAFSGYDPWTPNRSSHGSFSRQTKVIDPNLPLYKQDPPPCNEFYLMDKECSKGGRCKYSHEYDLTDDQMIMLAKNAKQSPCWFVNSGQDCPYGPRCCWGHCCPFGMKCFHLSKDKCKFRGAGMHRPKGAGDGGATV